MGEERLRRLTDRVRQLRARFLTRRQKWKVRQTDRVRQLGLASSTAGRNGR